MFLAVTNSKEENSMLALLPAIVVDHEKVFNLICSIFSLVKGSYYYNIHIIGFP